MYVYAYDYSLNTLNATAGFGYFSWEVFVQNCVENQRWHRYFNKVK